MLANVSGTFKVFKGTVESENDNFENASVNFEVDASSIDTSNEVRDGHLKSPEFLDIEHYSKITFLGVLQKQTEGYTLQGELALRGITKAISMDVEYYGTGKGRHGDMRAGFEATGKINRKDFGITFGLLTETGSLVVGEEIKLHFDIELIRE